MRDEYDGFTTVWFDHLYHNGEEFHVRLEYNRRRILLSRQMTERQAERAGEQIARCINHFKVYGMPPEFLAVTMLPLPTCTADAA